MIHAAFDKGQVPYVACFNKAVTPLGVDMDALVTVMQAYVTKYVVPVWGTPANLIHTPDFVRGAWAMVFLDDADQAGALAYHDLTPDGLPISKVFVRTTLQNNDLVSVSASHELVEMLVDPATNLMVVGADNRTMYAYESADPVEELSFPVNGVQVSDFVYPSYFESFRATGSDRFDAMGRVTKPFQVLAGGYQIVFSKGRWGQVFGGQTKARAFAAEDRRGHRSELRASGSGRKRSA